MCISEKLTSPAGNDNIKYVKYNIKYVKYNGYLKAGGMGYHGSMTHPVAQPGYKPVSESMFYMWRCVICMIHADGLVHEREVEVFDRLIAALGQAYILTPEHLETFRADMAPPQDIEKFLPQVTDPECQSLLIFFSQILASADGNVDFEEAELVGRLNGVFGGQLETAETIAAIRKDITARREAQGEAGDGRPEIYYAIGVLMRRLGVEMPD